MLRCVITIFLFSALSLFASQRAFAQITSPLDVTGLAFWVDAQDVTGTGVQPANGSVVTTWADKSPAGNNLTTQDGVVTFESQGFDGINPGLRFPLTARMAAGNPFAGDFQNEMTVFFVNSNVSLTRNFSVSLNGTSQGTNIADGRFSFHTPWISNRVFFDAGACCGSTRLFDITPNGLTETTLYTGLNDDLNNSQLLRLDGQDFVADTTGHNANVSDGISLGDFPGNSIQYNGRFAEVVIYDRGLSLSEIEDVECYLLFKWKPIAAPSDCTSPPTTATMTANKTVLPFVTTGSGSYLIPGNDVIYTIIVEHQGGADIDEGSVYIVDSLPAEVIFYNGDIDDGGPLTDPVAFISNNSGLSLDFVTDIGFSNGVLSPADINQCNYVPLNGYDPDVKHICINPSGIFQFNPQGSSFSISFRTQIK